MLLGISEEPLPPTERACRRTSLRDLLSGLEKNTSPFWKFPGLLIDVVCSVGLPLMIHFTLSPRPPAPIVRTRRPRQFINSSLGLIDLVRSSAPPAAPLLLFPPPPIARSELCGELLLEVFAVYVDFPFSGTIGLFDGRGGNYIYRRPDWDGDFYLRRQEWLASDGRHADFLEFKIKLLLTGPGRAMSAHGVFSIEVETTADSKYYALTCDDWDDCSTHNKPRNRTIRTNLGSLYVTCAVLSDAVEANVKVMVRLPWKAASARVHGNIMAYIGTLEIGSTLFSKDVDDAKDAIMSDSLVIDDSGIEFCLPLDRSILAVPIGSCLHVKGELVFNVLDNGSDTVFVNHSIPIESYILKTDWVQDNYCHTAVCLNLICVWG